MGHQSRGAPVDVAILRRLGLDHFAEHARNSSGIVVIEAQRGDQFSSGRLGPGAPDASINDWSPHVNDSLPRRFPLPRVFKLHLCEHWSDQLPNVSLLEEQKHRWTTGRALRESAALHDFRPPLVFSDFRVCSFSPFCPAWGQPSPWHPRRVALVAQTSAAQQKRLDCRICSHLRRTILIWRTDARIKRVPSALMRGRL